MADKKKSSVSAAAFAGAKSSNTFFKFVETVTDDRDTLDKAAELGWNQMEPLLKKVEYWEEPITETALCSVIRNAAKAAQPVAQVQSQVDEQYGVDEKDIAEIDDQTKVAVSLIAKSFSNVHQLTWTDLHNITFLDANTFAYLLRRPVNEAEILLRRIKEIKYSRALVDAATWAQEHYYNTKLGLDVSVAKLLEQQQERKDNPAAAEIITHLEGALSVLKAEKHNKLFRELNVDESCVTDIIDGLKKLRMTLPDKHKNLAVVDKALVPLELVARQVPKLSS